MQVEDGGPTPTFVRAWKLWLLLGLFVAGLCLLAWRLWHVQVLDSPRYGAAQALQSIRRVQIPGLRGRILDRDGVVLADNRSAYAIVIYCEELRQPGAWGNTILAVDTLIDQLAERLRLPRQVTSAEVARHVRQALPVPLIAWEDVDEKALAYLSEWGEVLPGVDIQPVPRRVYPEGPLAAHLLGYVGASATPVDDGHDYHYRRPNPHGRAGIEQEYDRLLAGASGEELLRVDSRGYTHERKVNTKARAGSDLTLTLDVDLQRIAEEALAGRPGAVVALDPRNGDMLALASAPTYDPNRFIPGISSTDWRALLEDPNHPLLNRPIAAQFAPGSVFKPFVAIAALERDFDPDTLYLCTGRYTDYNQRLRCAARYGHGEVDLRQALMRSCNPYFCFVGATIGMEAIAATAEQAGFGSRTGIDLPGEVAGLLPSPAWKRRRFADPRNQRWTISDTVQCSIGQGYVIATPLQVATATAAIANGGRVYRPRLVDFGEGRGDLQRRLPWTRDELAVVTEGMCMATRAGTGKSMRVEGFDVAAKTGTAEFVKDGARRKHVWSVAFAPADNPTIVVCAMLDDAIGGGRDAGPIVQKVLAKHLNTRPGVFNPDDESLQD